MESDRIYLKTGEEIGGRAGATIALTPSADKRRVSLPVPPDRVIPIIFLPGIMGSNLRMSRTRQEDTRRADNIGWRPDDLRDTLSRRKDSPAQRQRNFDPDETEVDRYEITEDADRFDMTGAQTVDSDQRHGNVPDGLPNIGLLMSAPLPPAGEEWKARRGNHESTAAQKARWRGWSEVMFDTYGTVIKLLEGHLNDMLVPSSRELSPTWKQGRKVKVLGVDPACWGGAGDALTEDDILRVSDCWYPVYAMGYNWLQSNGMSARKIARRIDEIIGMYKANKRKCEKVIVVTHSMGGLVARALLHPEYGNAKDKILGIYHGVQPALGAGAAYRRVRAGFEAQTSLSGELTRDVLGRTGKEVTAVFANASGPLELLPSASYPRGWLRLQTWDYRQVMALPIVSDEPLKAYRDDLELHRTLGVSKPSAPVAVGDPVYDIYGRNPQAWWRLLNPEWINPADRKYERADPYALAKLRIADALDFHKSIKDLYHPTTYASYGHDSDQKAYGSVTWRADTTDLAPHGDPLMWTLESEDAEGRIVVRTRSGQPLTLRVDPPEDAGDQTVPATASAEAVRGTLFRQTGYEHQDSYKNHLVLASTLYSIIRIANTAEWWDQ
ncbi:lipase family alpha/beta hydrolase [Cupriavidus oxalaticus]|uniref:lipase family alpha/beta hydrolase n=1 Tax=Cupriavidus oxalaticus TaxID=96344 RepID=UPI004033A516